MRVLIVEDDAALGEVWKRHLARQRADVLWCRNEDAAIDTLRACTVQVLILNLVLKSGSAIAVAYYASYRQPDARVIFVTNTSFFSDGSIFRHIPNACALLPSDLPPADLVAVVQHYGRAA